MSKEKEVIPAASEKDFLAEQKRQKAWVADRIKRQTKLAAAATAAVVQAIAETDAKEQ